MRKWSTTTAESTCNGGNTIRNGKLRKTRRSLTRSILKLPHVILIRYWCVPLSYHNHTTIEQTCEKESSLRLSESDCCAMRKNHSSILYIRQTQECVSDSVRESPFPFPVLSPHLLSIYIYLFAYVPISLSIYLWRGGAPFHLQISARK